MNGPQAAAATASVPGDETARLYLLLTEVFRAGLAATLAGVVFAGIGARVVMRISAAINADAAGAVTENGNVVGEITFGGTLELLLFNGLLLGLLMGTIWVVVREWLPAQVALRVSLAALLAALVGGSAVVDAGNIDFLIVEPAWLHIVMFVALVAGAGALTAGIDLALEGRLPTGEPAAPILGGLAGLGLMVGGPLLVVYYFVPGGAQNGTSPWPAGIAFAGVAVATLVGWARYYREGGGLAGPRPTRERALGYGGLLLFGLFGGIHLAAEINSLV